MRDFEKEVGPLRDKFIEVVVPVEKMKKIENFIQDLIDYKKEHEVMHQVDGNAEHKRWFTGLVGEAAVEEFLGIEFIDWTIGPSRKYNYPDVQGKRTGVKTSEWGNYPVIFKSDDANSYPQVICSKTGYNRVLICGIADEYCLRENQDDSVVKDPAIVKKGKTGFVGFHDLEYFYKDLERGKPGNTLEWKIREAREMREMDVLFGLRNKSTLIPENHKEFLKDWDR